MAASSTRLLINYNNYSYGTCSSSTSSSTTSSSELDTRVETAVARTSLEMPPVIPFRAALANAEAHRLIATESKKPAEAIERYRVAINCFESHSRPQRVSTVLLQNAARFLKNNRAHALSAKFYECLGMAYKGETGELSHRHQAGLQWMKAGEFSRAIQTFQSLLRSIPYLTIEPSKENPEIVRLMISLIEAQLLNQDYERAYANCNEAQKVLKSLPKNADTEKLKAFLSDLNERVRRSYKPSKAKLASLQAAGVIY